MVYSVNKIQHPRSSVAAEGLATWVKAVIMYRAAQDAIARCTSAEGLAPEQLPVEAELPSPKNVVPSAATSLAPRLAPPTLL